MFALQNHSIRQHPHNSHGALPLGKLSFPSGANPTRGRTFMVVSFMQFCLSWQLLLVSLFLGWSVRAAAQDWPQIMGSDRNGQATGHPPLSDVWPTDAAIAWQISMGSGFSGPAISDNKVLAFHRLGIEEVLEAVDLNSGRKLWRASWPATYRDGVNEDIGPRCVPTVAGKLVVCYGAAGDLAAVELDQGKLLWHRRLRAEYDAEDGYFGAGSSPLVIGQTIVVCLGGKQAGIVGVELQTGKTQWTATNYDASYAPPIEVGPHTALVVTRLHAVLIDTNDGQVFSEIPFGSRGPTVNAATPILVDKNRFLLTANYGVGATLLSIDDHQLKPIIQGSDLISSQYVTPVVANRRVIAIDGRDDGPPSRLCAIDIQQQKTVWEQPGFGTAHLIAVGSQVLALTKSGTLVLIDGQADEYHEQARMQLPAGTFRAPPALSTGKLIARDTNSETGRSQLFCLEIPLAK